RDDEIGAVLIGRVAEDAGWGVAARARHIREPPRSPQAFHSAGIGNWGLANPQSPSQTASASGGTDPAPEGEPAADSLLISSLSSFPGLKYGTFFGGTSTLSPVSGLRPLRGSRLRSRKLPNPRSSIFSPLCSASMTLRNTVSTITSECFLVRSDTRETSSTSSAFVMLPLVMVPLPSCLPVPEVIAESRRAVAGGLLIRLPVGTELVRFQRAD